MKQPNILLLFTDQQRFDTIGALGNPVIRTPALDSLVQNGTAFTRAYTPCPVCVPARLCMHTGKMPHRTGLFDNGTMPEGHRSFMEILTENGYATHGVGKMHFSFQNGGLLSLWGFESRETSEECGGAARDDFHLYLQKEGFGHVHDPHGVRSEMYYIPQPSQLPARLHNSAWVADRSIDFIRGRNRSKPFLLMSSFIKPHPPFEVPTPWNKLYRGPEMPLPKRPQDACNLVTYWNRFQNRYKYRDQGRDDNLVRATKAAYYGAISFIDWNIGRILDCLRGEGLFEDTLIVFTSDHGEMLGDYDCYGKRCFFDSAARIPMIVYRQGRAAGQCCDRPVSLVDVMPTLLREAGLDNSEPLCGDSLFDIAEGTVPRTMVTGQFRSGGEGMYMAVTGRYKYIRSAPDDREWLYDLAADPAETRNTAGNPLYRDALERMRGQLLEYYRREGYNEPFDGNAWKRYPVLTMPKDPDEGLLFQDTSESIPHIPGYEKTKMLGSI